MPPCTSSVAVVLKELKLLFTQQSTVRLVFPWVMHCRWMRPSDRTSEGQAAGMRTLGVYLRSGEASFLSGLLCALVFAYATARM